MANARIGAIAATALSVDASGHGLSDVTGADGKRAIQQVDRLLRNTGVDVWELFALWAPFVVADRSEIVVAIDWTEFDKDEQAKPGRMGDGLRHPIPRLHPSRGRTR